MSKPTRMQRCPHCGSAIARTKSEQLFTVDGTRFTASVTAYACRKCRAAFFPGRSLERCDLEIASMLALHAPPSGERLRFLRKALGLRAMSLAALLKVTAETMSRWERGQRGIDANAWITVGTLVLEKAGRPTDTLARLRGLDGSAKLPKTVAIRILDESPRLRIKLTRSTGDRAAPTARAASAR